MGRCNFEPFRQQLLSFYTFQICRLILSDFNVLMPLEFFSQFVPWPTQFFKSFTLEPMMIDQHREEHNCGISVKGYTTRKN